MIALTMTWQPRGEPPRLERFMPLLREVYQHILVALPPTVEASLVEALNGLGITPNRMPFVEHLPPAFVDKVGQDMMINRGSYDEQTRRWYNRRIVIRTEAG